MGAELKPGQCLLEVFNGAEGPCIYISDDDSGHRLAGPKPWGSARPVFQFMVKIEELKREIAALEKSDDNKD
ncbi:hypothetical protein [Castellaniella sp.]|uniref:hypothetical protein n=1 Tax=Castellaniella sp. TaxID=1955812 RepID=UPI002AFE2ECE|nr:hypothetical protein [Castellaniella sp.]